MSALFEPFTLKDVTLRNRIAVPPMCQYSAVDGMPNNWHWTHYANLSKGGAGLVIVEATAVSPEGRITPACLGLWNKDQLQGHAKIVDEIKKYGAVAGIQIGHAGRKASANRPWEGDDHIKADDPRGWETISPSATAFGGHLSKIPKEMSLQDIQRVKSDFVQAALNAKEAGYEWLELHFAHGYLGQSFFSVHANQRNDAYGGSASARGRFLLETLQAVREIWPQNLPLAVRFGVVEFDDRDNETLIESVNLIKQFRENGLDFINVSIGFSTPNANIPWSDAFMGTIAKRIREETGLSTSSAWGFGKPKLAELTLKNGEMDIVMIGRSHLVNPHWTFEAAKELGVEKPSWVLPAPYAHWLERYNS